MKTFTVVASALILSCASSYTATPSATPAPATPAPAKRVPFKYTPPKGAGTGMRIDGDGGSRGGGAKQPSLYVLAPNHTGLTTREQPSLFWYQSSPASTRFELALIEPKKAKPVLKVGAEKADQRGIHRVSLARHGIKLTPGVLYKWTVALVPDPANRSQDIIASGTIQRILPDAALSTALAEAKGMDKAALYARKGIWYDALEIATNEVNAAPKNKDLRRQRAALLEQAGLKAAAAEGP